MTEKQIRELFKTWQHRLGLDQWVIRVDFEEFAPPTSTMQIHRSNDYDRAIIQVQLWVLHGTPPPTWDGYVKGEITDRDIEEGVVHELLHAAIGRLWKPINMLRGEAHTDALDMACSTFDYIEENCVDRLAVALVGSWPER
jgi:hypothetical protein